MSDELQIDGDVEELCLQVQSGEAAEGCAHVLADNLEYLRQWAERVCRIEYPLHTPLAPGELPPDLPEPEPMRPFAVRLRAMLRETYDVRLEARDAGA